VDGLGPNPGLGPARPPKPSPADPPAWKSEWDSFSPECQKGLISRYDISGTPNETQIKLMNAAVDRANAQMEALTGAAAGTGITPAFLAAQAFRKRDLRM